MGKKKNDDKTVKTVSSKSAASAERQQRKKVRDAFRLVENLDNYRERAAGNRCAAPGDKDKKSPQKDSGSGLRLRFGLDAIISDSDTRAAKDDSLQPGESKLMDIHITIPYVWKIPILGKKALGMVRKVQGRGYPESIRDILKSLRAKSPL